MEKKLNNNNLNSKLIKELIKFFKDKELFLTWNDLLKISHKKEINDVCRFLNTKFFCQKGNIINFINLLESQEKIKLLNI